MAFVKTEINSGTVSRSCLGNDADTGIITPPMSALMRLTASLSLFSGEADVTPPLSSSMGLSASMELTPANLETMLSPYRILWLQYGTTAKGTMVKDGEQTLVYKGIAGGSPVLTALTDAGATLNYLSSQSADYSDNEGFSGAARQGSARWECDGVEDVVWGGDISQGFTYLEVTTGQNHAGAFSHGVGSNTAGIILGNGPITVADYSGFYLGLAALNTPTTGKISIRLGEGGTFLPLGNYPEVAFLTFYPGSPSSLDVQRVAGSALKHTDPSPTPKHLYMASDGVSTASGSVATTGTSTVAFPATPVWSVNGGEQGGFLLGTPYKAGRIASALVVGEMTDAEIYAWLAAVMGGMTL